MREFIQQAWFVASVTILPTALVSIPLGAVIALRIGSLTRQSGAQSFSGAASVLAVLGEASPIVTALLIAGGGHHEVGHEQQLRGDPHLVAPAASSDAFSCRTRQDRNQRRPGRLRETGRGGRAGTAHS